MNLLLCDIETTGLDPAKGQILEIYAAKLSPLPRPTIQSAFCAVIQCDKSTYDIHPAVERMHSENGLWEDCRLATFTQNTALASLRKWLEPETRWVLVGNSVHFDREWLLAKCHDLPLHHHVVDVSGFSRVLGSVRPLAAKYPHDTAVTHRAEADARQSLTHLLNMLHMLA